MEVDRDARVCVEREIEIAAPVEVVWGVLTNVDDMPRWFSLGESVAIDGPLAPGATIRMKGRGTGTIAATIEAADEPHVLGWTSRAFGLSVISVWGFDRHDRHEGGTRVDRNPVARVASKRSRPLVRSSSGRQLKLRSWAVRRSISAARSSRVKSHSKGSAISFQRRSKTFSVRASSATSSKSLGSSTVRCTIEQ